MKAMRIGTTLIGVSGVGPYQGDWPVHDDSWPFAATLHVDGKAVARVADPGNGGCLEVNHLEPFAESREAIKRAEDAVATLPPQDLGGVFLPVDLDYVIAALAAGEVR